MNAPTRPALRWHGGKWKLAPWIIAHFPKHRVYVEPFGGAASVLVRKPRAYAEVYNDLDADLVNLFGILRDAPRATRLIEALKLTPFARDEFEAAYVDTDDALDRARRMIVRSFMGFGSDGTNSEWRTGFRANSNRSGTTPAHDWWNYPDCLAAIVERFSGVTIENRDACDCMQQHDVPNALHYVDPPYLHATRSTKSRRKSNGGVAAYRHELSDDDHGRLLSVVRSLERGVVLSGYPHPMYDSALAAWRRDDIAAHADGARDRTEVLWINPKAAADLAREGRAVKQIEIFNKASA